MDLYDLAPSPSDERTHYVTQRAEPRELVGIITYLYGSKIGAAYHSDDCGEACLTDLGDYWTENEALAAIHGAATVEGRNQ